MAVSNQSEAEYISKSKGLAVCSCDVATLGDYSDYGI